MVEVLAFSESEQAELMRLGDGDAVSMQGALRVETYVKDGDTKVSLTCIADYVLALRQPARKQAPEMPADGQTGLARHCPPP